MKQVHLYMSARRSRLKPNGLLKKSNSRGGGEVQALRITVGPRCSISRRQCPYTRAQLHPRSTGLHALQHEVARSLHRHLLREPRRGVQHWKLRLRVSWVPAVRGALRISSERQKNFRALFPMNWGPSSTDTVLGPQFASD